jgi:hypothetical protein
MGSESVGGAAAIAIGAAFFMFGLIYSRNEDWRLRAAATRRLEHRLSPTNRQGKMTVQEWNQRFADQQKRLMRRVGIPFAIAFTALGMYLLIQGLISG